MTDERIDLERMYGPASVPADALEALLDGSLDPRGPDWLYEVVAELGVGPGSRVLDVGCRDGRHLAEVTRRFGCRGTGVEPVEANLARTAPADRATGIALVRGRGEALAFPPATFDLVWVRDVLVHVADVVGLLAEVARVLRPDGAVVVFQMFATPWLEPAEADRLWRSLAVVPASTDRGRFEDAVAAAGLAVERQVEVASEWREHDEERGERRTSRQLLRAARLLRRPDEYRAAMGDDDYRVELGDCLWGVYQMIGKLSPAVYVLRGP